MVKGISRRVIVVRSPDERLFEQAIFLLKEDALQQEGVTAQQVVQEAKEVADSYLRNNSPAGRRFQWLRRYSRWLWFLAGAVCAGVLALVI
ncbi:MAG: translation initiation factor 2 [Clostridiales bacterium]|nr:translation initiation factor 2 [Clostridiales bacterium]